MDIIKFLTDYSITYKSEGNKHCTAGWVNTHCPFCAGTQNFHLGYNISENYCHCWKCGYHPARKVIAKLAGVPLTEAKRIIDDYQGISRPPKEEPKVRFKPFKFPSGVSPLLDHHKKYLEKRRFDPDKLEKEWELISTGPISQLDNIDYKHRILIPIYWDGKMVSFQTRDVTGKSNLKYKACPKNREDVHHKNILYANIHKSNHPVKIITEGVTDVWRFGSIAIGIFGIEFSTKQIRQLTKSNCDEFVIIFDDEPQAIKKADKLVGELQFRGKKAQRLTIEGDPGNMKQEDANHLIKQINK